jgi:hypothetical protein
LQAWERIPILKVVQLADQKKLQNIKNRRYRNNRTYACLQVSELNKLKTNID